jgi:hypothetical protein
MEDFDTEAEARDAARVYLTPDEDGEVVDVLLVVNDDAGVPVRAIEGEELCIWQACRRASIPNRRYKPGRRHPSPRP